MEYLEKLKAQLEKEPIIWSENQNCCEFCDSKADKKYDVYTTNDKTKQSFNMFTQPVNICDDCVLEVRLKGGCVIENNSKE